MNLNIYIFKQKQIANKQNPHGKSKNYASKLRVTECWEIFKVSLFDPIFEI